MVFPQKHAIYRLYNTVNTRSKQTINIWLNNRSLKYYLSIIQLNYLSILLRILLIFTK